MKTPALDELVETLRTELAGEASGARIVRSLEAYARAHDDWRSFALFSELGYTRNLVVRDVRFELMLLCWGAGQESQIHNHEGQDCWMAVLDGAIEEVRYPCPSASRPGPLVSRGASRFTKGQVAFIRDEIGLHLVRAAPGSAQGGVSLHLYSAPYDECNCYCPETGRVTRKKLGHHSVRGRILAPSSGFAAPG